MEVIINWLYDNAMAIFISALASLGISKWYYNKANRDAVLITLIYPIIRILEYPYNKENYKKLYELKLRYEMRYLHKKEINALFNLMDNYRDVSKYTPEGADTDCFMAYYTDKLKENGINPKPCVIRDDEGNVVADDYPPNYHYLIEDIYAIVKDYEYVDEPHKSVIRMRSAFEAYTKEFYTDKEINFFDDITIDKIIQSSRVTKEWNKKFGNVKKSKEEFLNLSICKKAIAILNQAKGKK